MSTILFAYDTIAPMIGGVVFTGAFSFVGGVLLGRKRIDDSGNRGQAPVISESRESIPSSNRKQEKDVPSDGAMDLLFPHANIGSSFSSLAYERQQQELRLTRNMLELRSIVDSQSDEPIETLNQFVTRLCDMTNADRVAIYFVARRAAERQQPIVQSDRRFPIETEIASKQRELQLTEVGVEEVGVETVSNRSDVGDSRRQSSLTQNSGSVVMPIKINGRALGSLCVSYHDKQRNHDGDQKLIEFAAETLSQTLRRVFDEAAIRRQARHDHLTDLVNRRSLDAYLSAEIERIKHGESLTCSLILADLDHFKSINDQYGHLAGDEVLRATARVLSQQVSKLRMGERSVVARYGGEEFAILLPNVGLEGAVRIAEGIRAAIASEPIRIPAATLNVTISLGVAVCPAQANSFVSLIAAADKALYQAKSKGRNCVCQADPTAKGF